MRPVGVVGSRNAQPHSNLGQTSLSLVLKEPGAFIISLDNRSCLSRAGGSDPSYRFDAVASHHTRLGNLDSMLRYICGSNRPDAAGESSGINVTSRSSLK